MSFAQLTLTSPFLAGESHCIRIAPGHNWPLWELSPRMSLWPPELEYACGITLGRSYDSRTFCGRRAPREDVASQSLRGARTVSCACGRIGYRTGRGAPLPAQGSSERYCKRTLGHRVGKTAAGVDMSDKGLPSVIQRLKNPHW
jgi:hypothetical protein